MCLDVAGCHVQVCLDIARLDIPRLHVSIHLVSMSPYTSSICLHTSRLDIPRLDIPRL